jgi:hypothetical protein
MMSLLSSRMSRAMTLMRVTRAWILILGVVWHDGRRAVDQLLLGYDFLALQNTYRSGSLSDIAQ